MKKKLIKRICLVFENCEIAYIPVKYIKHFEIQSNYESMFIVNEKLIHMFNYKLNSLIIDRDYLLNHYPLIGGSKNNSCNLLTRLQYYSDLVSIHVEFKSPRYSKCNKEFYLEWNEDDEYTNKYQKVIENESKNEVEISVRKGE